MTSKVPSKIHSVLDEANIEEVKNLFLSIQGDNVTDPKLIKKLKSVQIDPDTFTKAAKAVVVNYYKKSTVPMPDITMPIDAGTLAAVNYKSKAAPLSFFKIHQFLNTFTNHLKQYDLTPIQLKVLSHIGFQGELSGSQPNLTISKIAKDLDIKFTTAQRCIEKLGEGYSYKSARNTDKTITQVGSGLVKHEKPEAVGGREANISISAKGKRFLQDIGSVISDFTAQPTDKVKFVGSAKMSAAAFKVAESLLKAMTKTNYIENFTTKGGGKKSERRKSK